MASDEVSKAQRKTARCSTCRGWGYVPGHNPMKLCECQPPAGMILTHVGLVPSATDGRGAPQGVILHQDGKGPKLPSERRREAREAKRGFAGA
jgi:hypothetical protein